MKKKLIKILLCVSILSIYILNPYQVQAKSRLEVVFIIDRSGSMGNDITGVKNNINAFVGRLQAQGIDYNLGLLSYERSVVRYDLTANVNTFKNNLDSIRVSGGTEHGLDALYKAMTQYTFYDNSVVYFVLIGDEIITSGDGRSQTSIVNQLNSRGITVTCIGEPYNSSNYTQFSQIANATGGLLLDMHKDYGTNLDTIFDEIQELPNVNITSPTPNQWVGDINGLIPSLEVTDPDSDTLTLSSYIDQETQPRDQQQITNSKQTQTINLKAIDINSLSEGSHNLKISVFDGEDTVNDIVAFQVDKTNPIIQLFSKSLTTENITLQGNGSDSLSGLAALPYKFDVGTQSSGWTSNTTHLQSNLQPNTQYITKFYVKDAVDHITTSEESVYTLAEKPDLSIPQVEENSVTIKAIDNNPNSTQYQVMIDDKYVTQSGSLTTSPAWITLQDKTLDIIGLSSGSNYSMTLKAKNGDDIETLSSSVNVTTLAIPPTNITLSPSQTSVVISWNSVTGATGYVVQMDNGTPIDVGLSTTYTHGGLTPETTHFYRVATKNSGGAGAYSSTYTTTTLPYPPAQPQTPTYIIEQEAITLSWPAVIGADYYEIKVDGVSKTVNGTSYTHSGLTPETTHTYSLRAINAGGESSWTTELVLATLPYPPETPELTVSEKTNTYINLSWTAMDRADGYQIEVDGLIIDVGDNTTYSHKDLIPLTTHSYRIRAYNTGGISKWSQVLNEETYPDPPKMPTNLLTTSDKDAITISWYQVEFVEYYEVEIDNSQVIQVKDRTYVHSGLNEGEEHSYRVRAVNVSGYSEWSTQIVGRTLAEDQAGNVALTNLIAIVTNEFITLSWDAVDSEITYAVEVDGNLIDLDDHTIYNHTGLEANEFHEYNIKVIDGNGEYWCANLALSTLPDPPNAPEGLYGDSYLDRIEIRWDAIEDATAYDIEIDGSEIITTNDVTTVHENLEPGTSHTYRIRAKNITGVTSWSPELNISTLNPQYVIDVVEGEEFTFTIVAQNVQDFSTASLGLTYDISDVEIMDVYEGTQQIDEVVVGDIDDTNIAIQGEEGNLVIQVNESIKPGTSWSGEIMTIRFKALTTGSIGLTLKVEEE